MMKSKYFLLLLLLVSSQSCLKKSELTSYHLGGEVFGTNFSITYFDREDRSELIHDQLDELFNALNQSVSTYIPESIITKINEGNLSVQVDNYFREVFKKSKIIYRETNGIFDPTVGNLVNAWGFGPEKALINMNKSKADSLLRYIGFDKINLVDGKIERIHPVYFDFNALAKGFGLDIAGRYLESLTIKNYLIELGGEIRTRGENLTKKSGWRIAIESPNFDGTRSIEKIVNLKNQVMATSGAYRKFKIDSVTGKRYHHIINPKTGYPAKSDLLSASVISDGDCADVDGYATALMAMNLEQAKQFLKAHPQLIGYLIFSKNDGTLSVFSTSNFKRLNDSL